MDASVAKSGVSESPAGAQLLWPRAIAVCCLIIILALVLGVGLATNLVVRHVIQTLPLWAGVVVGFRSSRAAGWFALPSFLCWAFLMAIIWAFLLGVSHVISGSFKPIEIVMTVIVGLAAMEGIYLFVRLRSGLAPLTAIVIFLAMAVLQFACLYVSFLPAYAHR